MAQMGTARIKPISRGVRLVDGLRQAKVPLTGVTFGQIADVWLRKVAVDSGSCELSHCPTRTVATILADGSKCCPFRIVAVSVAVVITGNACRYSRTIVRKTKVKLLPIRKH